jgi:hypothetical protein
MRITAHGPVEQWLVDAITERLREGSVVSPALDGPELLHTRARAAGDDVPHTDLAVPQRSLATQPQHAIADFLASSCDLTFQAWSPARIIWGAYRNWCESHGTRPKPACEFNAALRDAKCRQGRSRRIEGRQVRTWEGVRLRLSVPPSGEVA